MQTKDLAWPALPFEQFKPSLHLLHMSLQVIGKLKLLTPFEPRWANVALWLTSRGLTTGIIPYQQISFSVDVDFISHEIICKTSLGKIQTFALTSMSVAAFYELLFKTLAAIDIHVTINPMPQEIANPIAFHLDQQAQVYQPQVVNAWWRILMSTHHVLQRYHSRFTGNSPGIGLMWGTLDLRDARYIPVTIPATGVNADYIRRNAMDVAQVEAGWWGGTDAYPRAAYFSFTYPEPAGIALSKIQPAAARWDKTLSEFILDYDEMRQANDPAAELLAFFESTYRAGTELAKWDHALIGKGEPV